MDLHYRDFVVNDQEFLFDYTPGSVPSFHDKHGNTYCAVAAYQHPLPMGQLLYHDVQAVRAWPESARDELLAVAQCDVASELGRTWKN